MEGGPGKKGEKKRVAQSSENKGVIYTEARLRVRIAHRIVYIRVCVCTCVAWRKKKHADKGGHSGCTEMIQWKVWSLFFLFLFFLFAESKACAALSRLRVCVSVTQREKRRVIIARYERNTQIEEDRQ